MAKSWPQLEADELRQVRWLLGGALTLIAVSSVFYLNIDAWIAMGLATVSAIAFTLRPAWVARIPTWAHALAFPLIAAVCAADLWITGEPLSALVRLNLLLLAYRSAVYRKRRDDLQGIVLGLFLVVVAGVLTVSIAFALQIVAFTAVALALLLVITLGDPAHATETAALTPGEVPRWARHVEWRKLLRRIRMTTDWRVVAAGGALFGGLVVVSGVLFLAIPRFQLENTFWLDRFAMKKAKTGFSETIRFGDVTEITTDNSVAVTVDVSDREKVPAHPYWRMLVLDEYRDGTFRLSALLRRDAFGGERVGVTVRGQRASSGDTWTFYLEPGISRHLPLLGAFAQVQFQEAQNHRWAPGLGVLALRDEPARMTAYRVEGMSTDAELPDRRFRTQLLERATRRGGQPSVWEMVELSTNDRALVRQALVDAAVSDEASPRERAARMGAWLQARHEYSLNPAVPGGAGDPIVRWLVSREAGHCELFAGSMVVMARVAGLPARVVTGFRGGSWNGFSNNFTLRNADAHAWCEIFDVESGRWVRFDPTPGSGAASEENLSGEESLSLRLDRSWSARLDSLRVFWYRRIVNFDQRTQVEALKTAKTWAEKTGTSLREFFDELSETMRASLNAPWSARRIGRAGLFVVPVVACGWALRLGWRRWKDRLGRTSAKGEARVRAEAGRWLARVEPWCGSSRDAERIVSDLQRIRFGAKATWPDPTRTLREAKQLWRRRRKLTAAPRS